MTLAAIEIRKPKDWQAFERAMRVLLKHELGDASTQLNGRSGQTQSGVDISGRRASDDKLVGMQCKRHYRSSITEKKLRHEVKLAHAFQPELDQFILATTAEKDVAIERAARLITRELRRTSHPMEVSVWGWGDIEDRAALHADAINALDPTWNPFAERARIESGTSLRSIEDKLDGLALPLRSTRTSPHDVRLLKDFRALVTPNAMRFLAEADFRFNVRLGGMGPFNEIAENWLGAYYEFVDPELQSAFKPVMTALFKFVELVESRIFPVDENLSYGSPVTSWDFASGTVRERRAGAGIINDTAHVLWRAVDALERVARSKGL